MTNVWIMLLSSSIFHLTVLQYVAFTLLAMPLTFLIIDVGFVMKSCRSLVMEADALSSNIRGCESESNKLLHRLSLKCVDIVCMLQYSFDSHALPRHFWLLFHISHLRYCFQLRFVPVLIHVSRHISHIFIR